MINLLKIEIPRKIYLLILRFPLQLPLNVQQSRVHPTCEATDIVDLKVAVRQVHWIIFPPFFFFLNFHCVLF